jgi:hypothetical protein
MFEMLNHDDITGAYVVRGTGRFSGQLAIFSGPEARERAEAYMQWLNAGAAYQRRRSDPGLKEPAATPSR